MGRKPKVAPKDVPKDEPKEEPKKEEQEVQFIGEDEFADLTDEEIEELLDTEEMPDCELYVGDGESEEGEVEESDDESEPAAEPPKDEPKEETEDVPKDEPKKSYLTPPEPLVLDDESEDDAEDTIEDEDEVEIESDDEPLEESDDESKTEVVEDSAPVTESVPVAVPTEKPKKGLAGLKGKLGKTTSGKSVKKRSRKPKKTPKQMARDWMLGTPEKPVPVFGYRARFSRWFRVKFRGYVYLYTTTYNRDSDEYELDLDIIKKSKLPKSATSVTNQKYTYHWDIDVDRRGFNPATDNGFTASDAWCYIKCNKLDDAMRVNLDAAGPKDMKKVIIPLAIGFGIFVGLYYLFMLQ